jgi:hypothetical protein
VCAFGRGACYSGGLSPGAIFRVSFLMRTHYIAVQFASGFAWGSLQRRIWTLLWYGNVSRPRRNGPRKNGSGEATAINTPCTANIGLKRGVMRRSFKRCRPRQIRIRAGFSGTRRQRPADSLVLLRNPVTGIAGCCARAPRGAMPRREAWLRIFVVGCSLPCSGVPKFPGGH